jgi:hypothetical protein
MGAARVVGGILALAAGVLSLLVALDLMIGIGLFGLTFGYMIQGMAASIYPMVLYVQLILAILAILGGILALAGKKAGGIIALIVAIVWLAGGFIWTLSTATVFLLPFSAILAWTDQIIFMTSGTIISIEAIICLVGGILGMSGSD